jgi:hypothetical protein
MVHEGFEHCDLNWQEDYNTWNYWKMPLPDVEDEMTVKRLSVSYHGLQCPYYCAAVV